MLQFSGRQRELGSACVPDCIVFNGQTLGDAKRGFTWESVMGRVEARHVITLWTGDRVFLSLGQIRTEKISEIGERAPVTFGG